MSSSLNKLADALPNFILQMQEIKTRQDYYEGRSEWQAGMLAQKIRANELKEDALRAAESLGATERNRERRADMLKLEAQGAGWATAKYGQEQVTADFPGGIPLSRAVLKEPREKKPTAQNIAWARKRQGVFQKEITDIEGRIVQMRQAQGIAPGGKPKEPKFPGKKEEQLFIDNWDKAHKDLENVNSSLDSLREDSEKKGIDLGFGARTSPQAELPDPAGLLEGQTGTDSAGVSWVIRSGQWEENK